MIWGNKVTGDISTPLRFHASKELARDYLRTCTRDKWPDKHFEAVDWEHLELALILVRLHSSLNQKKIPKRFFLFDVGKINSVESGISNKCATIEVDYDENGGI